MFRGGIGPKNLKTAAATAAVFLLTGFILGYLASPAASKPSQTITVIQGQTITQTVSIAATTVQKTNQPAPFSAYAIYTCGIKGGPPQENETLNIPKGCPPPNEKSVTIIVKFTELGTQNSYISPREKVIVLTPGLATSAEILDGFPTDSQGRIVIRPNNFEASVTVIVPVTDLYSFVNWMRDVGKITLQFKILDSEGRHIQDVQVSGIVPYGGAWSIEEAAGEVEQGG
ncbi:MAG: hypothetical protein QW074_03860 [Candidatus Caldarchaeum sp.]